MADIEWLTYDLFSSRVGERFEVQLGEGEALPVELAEATESTEPGGPGPKGQERLQFSLLFRSRAEGVLPQGTYLVKHADLGELDLFLVPLGADAEGMRYEAAFA